MAQGRHFWLSHRRAQREVADRDARDATPHPNKCTEQSSIMRVIWQKLNSAETEKFFSKARCVALRAHEKHLMLRLQPRSLRIEPPGWGPGLSIFIISPGDSDVKPALSTSGLMLTFWEKFSRMDPHTAPGQPGCFWPQTFGPAARPWACWSLWQMWLLHS